MILNNYNDLNVAHARRTCSRRTFKVQFVKIDQKTNSLNKIMYKWKHEEP